jgi:uncharacterized membrane protein YkvA (DUF1232 family)
MWWQALVGTAVALLVVWLLVVVTLYMIGRKQDDPTTLKAALRLLPDVLRLLRRLAADPTLPRGVRVRLMLLIGYLLFPIDLVPDFIPVVGYADDAIVVALALRSVINAAGPDALENHWSGTPEGLRAIKRLAGIRA